MYLFSIRHSVKTVSLLSLDSVVQAINNKVEIRNCKLDGLFIVGVTVSGVGVFERFSVSC